MNTIKGLVLITRFDYIEHLYGRENLTGFVDALNVEDKNQLIQPIIISKDYSILFLKEIDEQLLVQLFNKEVKKFYELGKWNAHKLLPRYSQLYIDTRNPSGFLYQMGNLRSMIIGPGAMTVTEIDEKNLKIEIDYGLTYSESVRLSEMGLLEEGCRMCSAESVNFNTLGYDGLYVEYQVSWK